MHPMYKRILLKLSGEALAGEKHFGLDSSVFQGRNRNLPARLFGAYAFFRRRCIQAGQRAFGRRKGALHVFAHDAVRLERAAFGQAHRPSGFGIHHRGEQRNGGL